MTEGDIWDALKTWQKHVREIVNECDRREPTALQVAAATFLWMRPAAQVKISDLEEFLFLIGLYRRAYELVHGCPIGDEVPETWAAVNTEHK